MALSARDADALERVRSGLSGAGAGQAAVLTADLLQPGAAAELVEAAVDALGGLDILVCNAGTGWAGPISEITPAEIDAMVDLNLRAPLHLIHAALPHLAAAGEGRIVLVGSIAGRLGVAREVVYSATKFGLAGFADSLRAELAASGPPLESVSVSLVTPGPVDTPFFDRRNRPYERRFPRPIPVAPVANAVVTCARTGRAEITLPAWLALAARIQGAAPGLYRLLATRFG